MRHTSDVVKRPLLTEKSVKLIDDQNVYSFDVDVHVNKTEVKKAIEKIFGVKVERVNIVNVRPKDKRMGKYVGKTVKRRKAMVKLTPGSKIELFSE